MNKYLRLFRLGNGLMGIIGIAVGGLLSVGMDVLDEAVWIILGCLIAVAFIAGGNALNDYIDRDIDKTAHPERPVPSGELTPETARNLGIGMMALSAVLSLVFGLTGHGGGWPTTIGVLVCVALMFSYELFLKQRGFIGNLDIAFLTSMVFIVGGSIAGDAGAVCVFAFMALLVSVGREISMSSMSLEISKDIEDMDSDKGRRTLPMSVGSDKAAIVAMVFFIAGVVLSAYPLICDGGLWPYLLIVVPDAMFLYCAYIVRRDAHKAQKFAKIAMLTALLVFVLDVII